MAYRLRERHYRLWVIGGTIAMAAAFVWRRLMIRTTFIAITGSVGKTTAKECIAAMLASHGPTVRTFDTQNGRFFVCRAILRVRPWHRFAVIEVATNGPGTLWPEARVLGPDIALILGVAQTHWKAFNSLEEIAAEKIRIIDALHPKGVAILNGDDPRVAAMAKHRPIRVRTFGSSPDHDYSAGEASSIWPERLAFRLHRNGQSRRVRTQLAGEHWLGTALASLAVALECGLSLEAAAAALEAVPPYRARLEPVELPSGAILLRDDFNDEFSTLTPALKVLEQASSKRRVLVISGVVHPESKRKERMADLGGVVAPSADLIVFVGEDAARQAESALAAGAPQEKIRIFPMLPEAAQFLNSELREGDLALLRGCLKDHVQRLYFAQLGSVACWKQTCARQYLCDLCEDLKPGLERAAEVPKPPHPFWHPL
jgi:UDP-N-acetylmuramoyl-tripeptide--D-alanyl-D-alanine ligase